jgi:hypothetical protein
MAATPDSHSRREPPDLLNSSLLDERTMQPTWRSAQLMLAERILVPVLNISLLLSLAIWTALPFRSISLAQQNVSTFSWDAASHTLVALDLADSIKTRHPIQFLATLFAQHWWPPFYGILLSPLFLVLERSLDTASFISLLAYVAMPATAWLLIQRIFRSTALPFWTSLALYLLLLRSPILLEMSTWSMLELLGGWLSLLGWLAFVHRESSLWLRGAYLIGTVLYFTKYHYGLFLITTLLVFTLFEESSDSRRRLWLTLRPHLVSKTAGVLGCTASFLIAVRLIAELRGFRKSEIAYLPTVPNVLYAILVIAIVSSLYQPSSIAPIWRAVPRRLKGFCYCTVIPITVWLLIPANLRAWYRQTFQNSPQRADVYQQMHAVYTFMRNDYVFQPPALLFVLTGLVLAILTYRRRKILAGMVAYSLWPIFLMSLNTFPLEARFLACVFPTMMVTAICGWVEVLGDRRCVSLRLVAAGMLVIIALVYVSEGRQWHDMMQRRARYRYAYPKEQSEFIAAMIEGAQSQGPIVISLPDDVWLGPTIRLGLRLAHENVSPKEVVVEKKPLRELLGETERLRSGRLVIGCEKSAENIEVLQDRAKGRALGVSSGPTLSVVGSQTREMMFAQL